MNDLKPIEEGCLAVTINCNYLPNNGKFVTVIKDLGIHRLSDGGVHRLWEMDRELRSHNGTMVNAIRTNKLFRIDDPDLEKESEEELVYIEDKPSV